MLKPVLIFLLVVFIVGCQKEEISQYNQRSSYSFNPIQSDSCLLGEKILYFEDSISEDGVVHQIPVWRLDNFNVHDSLHISDVSRMYANYQIDFYKENAVVIQTKKLYSHAKLFTRLIEFDENGYQNWDTTIYNRTLGELIEFQNFMVVVLDHPKVSTRAYKLQESDYASKIIILDQNHDLIKVVDEQRRGLSSSFGGADVISEDALKLNFTVVEGCYGCMDNFWGYSLVLNQEGKLIDAIVSPPILASAAYEVPTSEELLVQEKLLWNQSK